MQDLTMYSCKECGHKYKTEEEAAKCETDPALPPKQVLTLGEVWIEDAAFYTVGRIWGKDIRENLTRNIDEVQLWSFVGLSHYIKTPRSRQRRRFRYPIYLFSDGAETIRVTQSRLSVYTYLSVEDRDQIVADILRTGHLRGTEEEEIELLIAVVDELIYRATVHP